MARNEESREDLLREATALVRRAEFVPATDQAESVRAMPIVIGFRRDASGSIFLGEDPVYQFNSAGQLRRAYRGGFLLKAEKGQLVRLERRRTSAEVQLIRHELTAGETASVVAELTEHLAVLHERLHAGELAAERRVPEDWRADDEILPWLESLTPVRIASVPNAR